MKLRERHQRCRLDLVTRRGHEFLSVENDLLRVTFVLTKGADVVELRHKPSDVDALWHSPHRLNPPGTQIPSVTLSRGSFFDYYPGGWQEILPAGGGPCTYKGAELGLHGEAMFLPWEADVIEDAPERVAVRLSVELRRTPFILERTVTLEEGQLSIGWHGRLTNAGEQTLAFMWGEHVAFGEPFIEPGCQIDLPPATVQTLAKASSTARYAPNQEAIWPYLRAQDGTMVRADRVLEKAARTHDSYTILPQEGWFAIRNPQRDLGFAMSWDYAIFPYLWTWQVYGGFWDFPYYGRAYALALEPFSSPAGALDANIERGTVKTLEPGQTIELHLRAGFFAGAATPIRRVDSYGHLTR